MTIVTYTVRIVITVSGQFATRPHSSSISIAWPIPPATHIDSIP
jgi:hypothetical protein